MNLEMGQLFFAVAFIIFLVLVSARIFVRPLRFLVKILVNSLVGLLLLVIFNFFGSMMDFIIPVNIVTILLAGFGGIPGLILLIIVQIIGI